MKICVSAAPLVGLLGTVTGMLTTFGALSLGSGGEKTMAMIAGGISEALFSTQMGLAVAIPGLLVGRILTQRQALLEGELAKLKDILCADQAAQATPEAA